MLERDVALGMPLFLTSSRMAAKAFWDTYLWHPREARLAMAQQTKVEHRRAYALPRADIDRPAQKLDVLSEICF